MRQEDTIAIKQAQETFDRTGFGLLVSDLMKRNPAMKKGQAIQQIARTYPEAHALYLRHISGQNIEQKEDGPEQMIFKKSRLGQAALALVQEGLEPTIEAATVRVMRTHPDLHDEFLNDLLNQ